MSNQAIDDALLLSRYITAHGLLPDNTLPDAIADAQKKLDAGNLTGDAEQTLNKTINASAKLILPMTIERLRSEAAIAKLTGWQRNVFWLWYRGIDLFTPVTVYVICIMIIVLIVPLTTHFNLLTGIVTELKETEKEDIVSLLNDALDAGANLARLRQSSADSPPPTPGAAQRPPSASEIAATAAKNAEIEKLEAEVQKKWKRLRELDSKININRQAISQTVDIETGEPRLWQIVTSTYGLRSQKIMPSPAPRASCDEKRSEFICMAFQFGVENGLSTSSPAQIQDTFKARRQAETLSVLLGSAILPVLYGLLGASVFLLRGFLGEGETSSTSPRPLAATAFLRLGLGGIAGLAIGWFWVPKAGETPFGTTPFALAFLAGFSIELLFSLLDRVLNAINPRNAAAVPK